MRKCFSWDSGLRGATSSRSSQDAELSESEAAGTVPLLEFPRAVPGAKAESARKGSNGMVLMLAVTALLGSRLLPSLALCHSQVIHGC